MAAILRDTSLSDIAIFFRLPRLLKGSSSLSLFVSSFALHHQLLLKVGLLFCGACWPSLLARLRELQAYELLIPLLQSDHSSICALVSAVLLFKSKLCSSRVSFLCSDSEPGCGFRQLILKSLVLELQLIDFLCLSAPSGSAPTTPCSMTSMTGSSMAWSLSFCSSSELLSSGFSSFLDLGGALWAAISRPMPMW